MPSSKKVAVPAFAAALALAGVSAADAEIIDVTITGTLISASNANAPETATVEFSYDTAAPGADGAYPFLRMALMLDGATLQFDTGVPIDSASFDGVSGLQVSNDGGDEAEPTDSFGALGTTNLPLVGPMVVVAALLGDASVLSDETLPDLALAQALAASKAPENISGSDETEYHAAIYIVYPDGGGGAFYGVTSGSGVTLVPEPATALLALPALALITGRRRSGR